MAPAIILINTNIAQPPVSPVGLEYVGEALIDAAVPVRVLDLSFETYWKASLRRELKHDGPLVVGLSVRNTDDCSFTSRKTFLPWISNVVMELRKLTERLCSLVVPDSPQYLRSCSRSRKLMVVLKVMAKKHCWYWLGVL